MITLRFISGLAVFAFCFAFSGCDTGGSAPEVVTNQSELEAFLEANPGVEEGLDTGEEEEPDE